MYKIIDSRTVLSSFKVRSMAVFEKEIHSKILLDDTDPLTTHFLSTQIVDNHVEYVIRVHQHSADKKWNVSRRYNDFVRLHSYLSASKLQFLQLPPKKLLGNMDREFIMQRQAALQEYLEYLLFSPLRHSIYIKRFLDPENYCQPFQEQALQHVSMVLRSDPRFEILKPMDDIGWRLRKHYFTVRRSGGDKGDQLLLSWTPHGPDQHLDTRQLTKIATALSKTEYPYLEPCLLTSMGEAGGAVIRKFYPEGSLRDAIYGSKPMDSWICKLSHSDKAKPFSEQEIARLGAKVLDTLIFLADKGLHYGHLHPGNIVVTNEGLVRLLDLENSLLGLPCMYRPLLVQLRKVYTPEAVDAYCLGHTLYEMVFGRPLTTPTCESSPDTPYECSPLLWLLLESLLGTQACRKGLPSLVELRTHPFFAGIPRIASASYPLQISSQLRQALSSSYSKAETRLREDQKKIRQEKRHARVQQHLIQEEQQQRKGGRPPRPPKAVAASQQSHTVVTAVNGKSPERSDSPTSTNTSGGTLTPPPPTCAAPADGARPTDGEGLSALLGSICNFDKGSLRSSGGSR